MSTFSPSLRIELITTGDQAGVWGNTTNTNLGTLVESAITGYVSVSITSADQALTAVNGAADQSRNQVIALTTTTGAAFNVYAPPAEKTYTIYNASAYAATLYNSLVLGNTIAAGAGAIIPAGKTVTLWSDGTNFVFQNNHLSSLTLGTALPVTSGGTGTTTSTGTGSVVLSNSPTLVTPALGTPSAVVLTNGTDLPLTTGTTGTLPASRGGTGATAFTATGVAYASSTSALTTGLALTFSGAQLGVNGVTLGRGAGAVATNTAVGAGALQANTNGYSNTATGAVALFSNTIGNSNTAVGYGSLYTATTAAGNTALGAAALYSTTTGYSNTALGRDAMYTNTTGYNNAAVGSNVMFNNTTGFSNAAVGVSALRDNTTGAQNTAIGASALRGNTTANNNTANGFQALQLSTTGAGNTGLGVQALQSNTTGANNTAVGLQAGLSNATGAGNVFLGYSAGKYEIAGDSFYVDNQDRTDTAGDKAKALLYGTFSATPASQTLVVNAKLTATYGVVTRVNSQTTTTSPWAWNSDNYDQQEFTALANALTINADAGSPANGQQAIFRFTDNGTAQALTWTTGSSKSFRSVGTPLPTTTLASKTLYVGCIYNSAASRWDVIAVAQET